MTIAAISPVSDRPGAAELSARKLVGLWLLSGVILLIALGNQPVTRTQEARVLETSRQMLGSGAEGWLIPHINGRLRLQKPPLCYWMTATMYEAFGRVDETVGRIPTALTGWLTLGVTFIFARRLFDQKIALVSCAAMLGSYYFFQFTRLAETDAPSMLFVTAAIYAFWRASNAPSSAGWLHLAGAMTGMAIVAKGGPGGYPPLFLLTYCAIEKKWSLLKRFFSSGAIATLLIIALPWFIYIAAKLGTGVFFDEIDVAVSGRNHFDWPTLYIPLLLVAVAPWSGVLPLALWDAGREWSKDAALRLLLVWGASIIIPLCFIGNKQPHYLVPIIPPLMILIGRAIVLMTSSSHPLYQWMRWILFGTLFAAGAGAAAIIFVAIHQLGHIRFIDPLVSGAILLGAMLTLIAIKKRGTRAGFRALVFITALLMPVVLGFWLSTVYRRTTRTIAQEIQQDSKGAPYVFFGPNISLVLCFNLRAAIPWAPTENDLAPLVQPGTIVIAQTKSNVAPPTLPDQYVLRKQVQGDDQVFDLYEFVQKQ